MESLKIILEVVKYAIPALLVLLAMKLINEQNLKRQNLEQKKDLSSDLTKQYLPLKLSAYERLVLFLERIQPLNLISRLNNMGVSAREYYAVLVHEVRSEYEHNLAQQIYVSEGSWQELVKAKEEVLGMINLSMQGMPPEASAVDLCKQLIANQSEMEKSISANAILRMKKDLKDLFEL